MVTFWKLREKSLTNMQVIKYNKSFRLFLKNTNEKMVILKFIRKYVNTTSVTNFLDIGGGDGTIASSLAKEFKSTVIIEPNPLFVKKIKQNERTKIINDKWENVNLKRKFDIILAAYVVTYFPQEKRKILIRKMYQRLNNGGKIIILSVDARRGSWRKIHTFFYQLMGLAHMSSDERLREIIKDYCVKSETFKTEVKAKSIAGMLDILSFDFLKYPEDFKKYKKNLKQFLSKHKSRNGNVILSISHNAYIITKK